MTLRLIRLLMTCLETALLVTLVLPTATVVGQAPTRHASSFTALVVSSADSGPGTLRQALLDANAAPGISTITFNIASALPVRIVSVTALPEVTGSTIIDATTQPGYDGTPVVELHSEGDVSIGITLLGSGSTVRGLVVNGFSNAGILLAGDSCVVESCFIGTNASGTAEISNQLSGIEVTGDNCRIGGTSEGAGNLISGNGGQQNAGGGVYLNFAGNAVVEGNEIGTDVTRAHPLGNAGAGVRCRGSQPLRIGGTEPGSGNVIAFNGRAGIYRESSLAATVLGNSIFGNQAGVSNIDGRYGIHSDTGYFGLDPRLISVTAGSPTRIMGALTFSRSALFGFGTVRFEVFRNVDCSDLGFGQGKEFLGAVEVERRTLQTLTFEMEVDVPLGPGETFTCTATTPSGSTSPFSNCLGVTGSCELPFNHAGANVASVTFGQRATLEATVSGSEPIAYQWFELIPEQGPSPINGETSRTYVTPPLTEVTSYTYTASNACGSASGAHIVEPCTGPPVIVREPVDYVAIEGQPGFLAIGVPAGSAAEFQWYEGRRGDTARPVPAQIGVVSGLTITSTLSTATYWCRISNACGSVDSKAAKITVLQPMVISSVEIKIGGSGKHVILARGSGIPTDVRVYVGNDTFEKIPKVSSSKITQRGLLGDGRSIDEAVPIGVTTRILFFSPTKGTVSVDLSR